MSELNYKRAYEYLESQIEDMMYETAVLLDNNPATLRIDDIIVEQNEESEVDIIISSSGECMKYALYIYNKGEGIPFEKMMYQNSNTFKLNLKNGRYIIKAFVQQNEQEKVAEKKQIRVY
ncbi:hypothetical protein K0018_10075 [Staphylococcus massiliensis]|uniref:hypothetical protein n=1 Tax=Staphylococcus massiliensis TaxID=555791 RepID=UPI001EE05E2C|nr:hypothetical protein [Staphylococcus massiliensis]MCG3413390.1 hypothetical protein [Staphylococcus massiliensis]